METDRSLEAFFNPRGLAVVGARATPGFGYTLPLSLIDNGWGDRLHLVNPKGGTLHGMTLHRSVADVPDPVDLAAVMVPAPAVPQVLDEVGRRGIKCAIVMSAGFAETGEQGRALQEEARAAALRHGVRVIGPNCVGVINTQNRFSTVEVIREALEPGSTAIIAQSGVFGNVLLDRLHYEGIRISKAVTLGNRLDVNECDILEILHHDPHAKLIMMYLEGAADGARLVRTLQAVCQDKPVLVLKSGRTTEGRAATASHTGSLAGEDRIYDAVFTQTGAVRAQTLEELLALARVFSTQPLPKGPRLAVLTTSGSLGALATDAAIDAGLVLPPPSPALIETMTDGAPGWMNVKNPLDIGPSGLYQKALEALLADPGYDLVLAVTIIPYEVIRRFAPLGLTPATWFGDIAPLRAQYPDKPLVVCAIGHPDFVRDMGVIAGPATPVLSSPELAARALARLWDYAGRRTRERI